MEEATQKTLIRMKVSNLVPYERNPRKIPQNTVDAAAAQAWQLSDRERALSESLGRS